METLEIIKPTKIKDFVGNKLLIQKLIEIFKNKNYEKKFIGIVGPDGSGKTTICNIIFKNLDFEVLNISKENYSNKETLLTINNFIKNKTIDSFFNKKQKIVFFDDIDIISNIDRSIVSNLLSLKDDMKKYNIFIVITCNTRDEKKVNDFKKDIEIFKLTYPSIKDTYAYLINKDITNDLENLLKLVQYYRGSIRDIIMNLDIGNDNDPYKFMFKDMNNFEIITKIINNNITINTITNMVVDDSNMITFLLYENFLNEISNKDYTLKNHSKIIDYYIDSTTIETSIYETGNWNYMDVVNSLRILPIKIHITDKDKKYKDNKYRFSQILSKISHRNMLRKKINNYADINYINSDNIFMLTEATLIDETQKNNIDLSNFCTTYEKYFIL